MENLFPILHDFCCHLGIRGDALYDEPAGRSGFALFLEDNDILPSLGGLRALESIEGMLPWQNSGTRNC